MGEKKRTLRGFLCAALGGVCWVCVFTLLGYFFGNVPFVVEHFELVIVGIVVISFLPTAFGLAKAALGKKKSA